jgi:hypothetical protein
MYAKSIFGHSQNEPRHMIHSFQNNEHNKYTVENLHYLEKKYTQPLSSKNYQDINTDLLEYSELYSYISKIELNTQQKNMKLLFKISLQGLVGAIHAFDLNKKNVELNIENMVLKNKLETVLSGKNKKEATPVNSNISLMKTFTLAPLYSYYIILFGKPEQGFEHDKLNQIMDFMKKYNIDPYQ